MYSDMEKNQDAIIDLLKGYNPEYFDSGESFGEQLVKGLASQEGAYRAVLERFRAATESISGGSVSIGVNGVPALATGGVVTRPTLALVGEGRESEAVLPLSVLGSMLKSAIQTTADSIAERFSGGAGGSAPGGAGGVLRPIEQHVNIYQPVQSPAETARAVKNAAQEMAFA